MSAEQRLRIGAVAEQVGLSARAIRYYEELGLLDQQGPQDARAKGRHRQFTQADVERLRELIRLRDLLGLSLEELKQLAEAAQVSQCLRQHWQTSTEARARARIVRAAIPNVQRQLDLVRGRQSQLADFATELENKLEQLTALLSELVDGTARLG